ncbi:MAG: KH domain-containing protein [bacterium]|nr:KH domain-containing protein [bacterium]
MSEPSPGGTRELLLLLVTRLVDHPERVRVEEEERPGLYLFRVVVDPDDLGKIIGRGGRMIRAIRQLVRAQASVEGRRAMIEVSSS